MAIQGSQAVLVATPIVFWRPTRFSRSQETAESHRLLTIIFVFVFVVVDNTIVYDIVRVIANAVRVKSHRPSLLMSSSSSYYVIAINAIRMTLGMFTRPLIVVLDDIFVVVVILLSMYVFRMTLGMFTRPLIAAPVEAVVVLVIFLSH